MTCAELGLQLWYAKSTKFKDFNVGSMEAFVASHPDVFNLDTSKKPHVVSLKRGGGETRPPSESSSSSSTVFDAPPTHDPPVHAGSIFSEASQMLQVDEEEESSFTRRSPSLQTGVEDDCVQILVQILRRRQVDVLSLPSRVGWGEMCLFFPSVWVNTCHPHPPRIFHPVERTTHLCPDQQSGAQVLSTGRFQQESERTTSVGMCSIIFPVSEFFFHSPLPTASAADCCMTSGS